MKVSNEAAAAHRILRSIIANCLLTESDRAKAIDGLDYLVNAHELKEISENNTNSPDKKRARKEDQRPEKAN